MTTGDALRGGRDTISSTIGLGGGGEKKSIGLHRLIFRSEEGGDHQFSEEEIPPAFLVLRTGRERDQTYLPSCLRKKNDYYPMRKKEGRLFRE